MPSGRPTLKTVGNSQITNKLPPPSLSHFETQIREIDHNLRVIKEAPQEIKGDQQAKITRANSIKPSFSFVNKSNISNTKNTFSLNIDYWNKNIEDSFVTEIINNGVKLLFKRGVKRLVNSRCKLNAKYSNPTNHKAALKAEIEEMLKMNIIYVYEGKDYSFFSKIFILNKGSENRPIINLQDLNKFIKTDKFKMISWKDVATILTPNSYAVKFDISKAYYHVKIHRSSQRYIAFSFEGRTFRYNSLPFGLSSAPFLFNRIMNACIAYIRPLVEGIILFYLDDIIIIANDYLSAEKAGQIIVAELNNFGWSLNMDKTDLIPKQAFTYLGVNFDAREFSLFPSDSNLKKIQRKAKTLANRNRASLRELESFMGSANFVSQFLKEGKLYLHPILKQVISTFNFSQRDRKVRLPTNLKTAIARWSLAKSYTKKRMENSSQDITLVTDASLTGWGAALILREEVVQAQGIWNIEEKQLHINNLEYLAIIKALTEFSSTLRNKQVFIMSDNITTIATLKRMGSHKFELKQKLAQELFKILTKFNIQIHQAFIRGSENILADSLSREHQVIPMELEISSRILKRIFKRLDLYPEIDLFATHINHKTTKFFSAIKHENATAFNAFAQNWGKFKTLYAFPPPHLIPKVLMKWEKEKTGYLILIAPVWKHSYWITLLQRRAIKTWPLDLTEQDTYLQTREGIKLIDNKKFFLAVFLL